MSEITYIKCDGSGCAAHMEKTPTIDLEALGWTKDDMDADFCADCTKAAANLEANTATADDVAALTQALNTETDKVEREKMGVPLVGPMVTQEQFDKALEATVKQVRKDLKKQGQSKEFIEETISILREQAAEMRRAK